MTDPIETAQWLTRFEKRFGVSEARQSMQKMNDARKLFFDELGYDITRKQYEHLREGLNERIQIESQHNVYANSYERHTKSGKMYNQIVYRDEKTNKYAKNPFKGEG